MGGPLRAEGQRTSNQPRPPRTDWAPGLSSGWPGLKDKCSVNMSVVAVGRRGNGACQRLALGSPGSVPAPGGTALLGRSAVPHMRLMLAEGLTALHDALTGANRVILERCHRRTHMLLCVLVGAGPGSPQEGLCVWGGR